MYEINQVPFQNESLLKVWTGRGVLLGLFLASMQQPILDSSPLFLKTLFAIKRGQVDDVHRVKEETLLHFLVEPVVRVETWRQVDLKG